MSLIPELEMRSLGIPEAAPLNNFNVQRPSANQFMVEEGSGPQARVPSRRNAKLDGDVYATLRRMLPIAVGLLTLVGNYPFERFVGLITSVWKVLYLTYLYLRSRDPIWLGGRKQTLITYLASAYSDSHNSVTASQRNRFTETPLILGRKVHDDHTHGESALLRNAATAFVADFSNRMGLQPYYVQCSKSDQRKGHLGSRNLVWAKDLTAEVTYYNPPPDSVLCFIDVDYYIEMTEVLIDEFKPIILYTFQPEQVARIGKEYSYTFNAENEVVYHGSGGLSYPSLVWNWTASDHVRVVSTWWGIPYKAAIFMVDRKKVGTDREIICLTPQERWTGFGAVFGSLLSGYTLQRLKPVRGEYLRMYVHTKDKLCMSTGLVGKYAQATIRADRDDTIGLTAKNNTNKLQQSTVLSYIEDTDIFGHEDLTLTEQGRTQIFNDKRTAASVLLDFHRNDPPRTKPPWVFPLEQSVRNYDVGVRNPDPEAKKMVTAFMHPLINGAFTPVRSNANDLWAIEARVTNLQEELKAKPPVLDTFLLRTMDEFCELFIPIPHLGIPCDLDTVYERQNRPTQRATLDSAMSDLPYRLVKSFPKKESYGEVKPPRMISTINGPDKREYSRYIYPVADHLKTIDWYAFGIPPVLVALRVVLILCMTAYSAINSDYSRFDGRVTHILRELERKILIRFYGSEYVGEIMDLHGSQIQQKAISMEHCNRYHTGWSRLSGSPETSAFNSIANAFVAFLAFRMTKVNGGYISPEESWTKLGIYGGDDGLTSDMNPVVYKKAAARVGLLLTSDVIQKGHLGVSFLSRMYGPGVWNGDPNSCCDLLRQLRKFHVTVKLNDSVTGEEKLAEKSRSFIGSDGNTPVLGQLVSKAVSLHGTTITTTKRTAAMRRWNSEVDAENQYPNEDDGWMEDYARQSLSEVAFDFDRFNGWIESVSSFSELLKPPLCGELETPKTKVTVVVDGEVIIPEVTPNSVQRKKGKGVSKTRAGSKSRTSRSEGYKRGTTNVEHADESVNSVSSDPPRRPSKRKPPKGKGKGRGGKGKHKGSISKGRGAGRTPSVHSN